MNLRAMVLGDLNRLKFVRRYSTCLNGHDETVAEHSFYVAMYGLLIARWHNSKATVLEELSVASVLEKCLIHDMEEARTGDMPRPFKYRKEELREMCEEAAALEMYEMAWAVTQDEAESDQLTELWLRAKSDGTKESLVVAFADYLSCLSFMATELSFSNTSMARHYQDMSVYVANFASPEYDFLRELVDDATNLTHEVFSKFDWAVRRDDAVESKDFVAAEQRAAEALTSDQDERGG